MTYINPNRPNTTPNTPGENVTRRELKAIKEYSAEIEKYMEESLSDGQLSTEEREKLQELQGSLHSMVQDAVETPKNVDNKIISGN